MMKITLDAVRVRANGTTVDVGRSRPTEVKIRETEGGELQLQGEEGREEEREMQ